MAEVLGVVASLIALVQISGSVISLCYEYRHAIKNPTRVTQKVLQDVRGTRDLIERLLQMVDDDSDQHYLPSLQKLNTTDGPFALCQSELKHLEDRLKQPVGEWKLLKRRLIWPLLEKEVDASLRTLSLIRDIIELGLAIDTTSSIFAIRNTTDELLDRLKALQTSDIQLARKQRRADILKRLDLPNQSTIQARLLSKRDPESAAWFLEDDQFQAWKTASSPTSSMWVHGTPGCGKSMLCSLVVDHLQNLPLTAERTAVAYYFLDFSDRKASTPAKLLCSLIVQLSSRTESASSEDLFETLEVLVESSDGTNVDRCPTGDLLLQRCLELFVETTRDFDRVFVVIDALDECSERTELLQVLSNLSRHAKGLHIFLASRNEASIAFTLGDMIDVEYAIRSEDVDGDIDTFVKRQLREHPKLKRWSASLQADIKSALVGNADGMFRWVDCTIANLAKCLTVRDVKNTLKTLPKSLAETYSATLNGMDEHHYGYAIKVLMWLAISPRPLRLEEAVDILAIDLDADPAPVFDASLRFPDPIDIPIICSSLVMVTMARTPNSDSRTDIGEIRLAHHTVKEYLLSCLAPASSSVRLFADLGDVYDFAARSCLTYLEELQDPITPGSLKTYPLARYAAEFWVEFVRKSDRDSTLQCVQRLLGNDGNTEPYRNWAKLFDPDRPWADPDLERSSFHSPLYYASFAGLRDVVRWLLDKDYEQASTGIRRTALATAASYGHLEVVQMILESSANLRKEVIERALREASRQGHREIVQTLIRHGADVNVASLKSVQVTPAVEAAYRGHVEVVRLLVDAGANVDVYQPQRIADMRNAVEAATCWGYKACVSAMIPNASGATLRGALLMAFSMKNREMIEFLIDHVPDDVLDAVIALGHTDLTTQILERRENVLAKRIVECGHTHESTALTEACSNGQLDLVTQLIARGADAKMQARCARRCESPLVSAADAGYAEIVKLLLSHGADVEALDHRGSAIETAAYHGHIAVVEELIGQGVTLSCGDGRFGGPLQAAIQGNRLDVVQLLVGYGANVNQLATQGRFPFHLKKCRSPLEAAVRSSFPDVVDWLLDNGADPNIDNGAPMSSAGHEGDVRIIESLLKAGANVKPQKEASDPSLPLLHAVRQGHLSATRRLLAAGANPHGFYRQLGECFTLLSAACQKKNAEIVSVLIEAGVDINENSEFRNRSEPPLHTAAAYGTRDLIHSLIQYGAKVNEQVTDGFSPLHIAVISGQDEIVRSLLFDHSADPTLTIIDGSQAIHLAATHNKPRCIQVLLDVGVSVDTQNLYGRTPLHWAAMKRNYEAVEFLLDNGADVGLKELEKGLTAKDYAELHRKEATSSLDLQKWKQVIELFER